MHGGREEDSDEEEGKNIKKESNKEEKGKEKKKVEGKKKKESDAPGYYRVDTLRVSHLVMCPDAQIRRQFDRHPLMLPRETIKCVSSSGDP